MTRCATAWTLLLPVLLLGTAAYAQSNVAAFSFPDSGGVSLTTSGVSPALQVGYANLTETGAVPAGFAIFGLRQNNALVSEVTIPAGNLIHEGRIFAETAGPISTGLAIANPSSEDVRIAFYFTDIAGNQIRSDSATIPAKGQIARFLHEAPFSGPTDFLGTFTFFTLSSVPDLKIAATALRGFFNEHGEFLMTTLPVSPIGSRGSFSGDTIPHFASGSGWGTQIILLNPTDGELAGQVTFSNQAGSPSTVATDRGSNSVFDYHIAARSSWRLQVSEAGALQVGSVRLSGASFESEMPVGFLIFTYKAGGVTVTSSGVPTARSSAASRLFVESSGQFDRAQAGSLQSGIAIANAGTTTTRVTLELFTLSGAFTGLRDFVDLAFKGQTAKFLGQIPGFQSLPQPFQGILRISSTANVSVTGLRGRYNERQDFMITTMPLVNESDEYFESVLKYTGFVFPQFVDGGGYTTQFVLFSGWTPGQTAGTIEFFDNKGAALPVSLK